VLIGGVPTRVLRLTPAGAEMVDGWVKGRAVGSSHAAGVLAARLVESGTAFPVPGPSDLPAHAVVIPVLDDPPGLAATLATLDPGGGRPVTVVDDGSDPPVPPTDGVVVLRHDRPGGPGRARNAGVAASGTGEIVVFIDAGCVPAEGWLPRLLGHFADPAVAAVAPRITTPPVPGPLGVYEQHHSPLDLGPAGAAVGSGRLVPYVPTTFLAVRRGAFACVGGFDEQLRFGEDVDLVWRLVEAGYRVIYDPAAQAGHPARADLRTWAKQRFDYGTSAAPLAHRHGRAVAPLAVQPWTAAAWTFLATGHPLAAAALIGGGAWVLGRRTPDPQIARGLRRLAVSGNVRAGRPLAAAVRRAWLPPVAVAGLMAGVASGRRTRLALAWSALATAVGPGLADWVGSRPALDPLRWVGLGLADDLAYQAGVWTGCLRARSAAALLPRW
jgi:mycofactocin system glycosyltransferase